MPGTPTRMACEYASVNPVSRAWSERNADAEAALTRAVADAAPDIQARATGTAR